MLFGANSFIHSLVDINPDLIRTLEKNVKKRLAITSGDLEENILNLAKSYNNEELVLVLGTGVSMEYGLPSWDTLLEKLLLTEFSDKDYDKSLVLAKLFSKNFSPNPLIAARYLRNAHDNKFDHKVKEVLYANFNNNFQSDLFSEIIQMCVAPGKSPNLDCIITYNYDNILEMHLSSLDINIPYESIYKVGQLPKNGELPIYHVHGYLPQKGKLDKNSMITLSEDIYHKQYNDIYSWNNLIQINKFRENTCIFIGLSLTDPNLRRLLDIANKQRGSTETQHYSIRKKYDRNSITNELNEYLQKNTELLNQKNNANLNLDETVEYLVKVKENFETQDDYSFGMKTIWVKNYDEIPKILKRVRENNNSKQSSNKSLEEKQG